MSWGTQTHHKSMLPVKAKGYPWKQFETTFDQVQGI